MRPASPRPPPPILRRMRRCGWRRTYHTDSTRNSQGITRREHLCALTFETPVFVWFITFFTAFYGNGKGARDGSRCRALECHIEAESQSESIELNHTALLCIGGESRESGGLTGRSRRSFRLSVLLYRGPRVLAFAHSPGPLASCAIGLKLLQVGDRCLQGVEAANEGEPQVAATEVRIHLRRVAKIEIIALANRILGGGRAKA